LEVLEKNLPWENVEVAYRSASMHRHLEMLWLSDKDIKDRIRSDQVQHQQTLNFWFT
jgi:hypothetical protein